MHTTLWLLLPLLLVACGYQLRGGVNLPPGVETVYIEAPGFVLREALRIGLEAGGVRTVAMPQGSDARLLVGGEREERRVLSVNPRTGKVQEYALGYVVSFQLLRADGTVLVAPQQLRLSRDFFFDPEGLVGKGEEEALLYEEMRRDAAYQILRRLGGAATA